MKNRRRIRIAIPLALLVVALTAASTAWACTYIYGQTYINGKTKDSVSRGSSFTATAEAWDATKPANGQTHKLVATTVGGCCLNYHHVFATGQVLQRSSTGPDLGPTSATVPSSWRRQDVSVCYLSDGGAEATQGATLTVL